jgi:hypothetical protein
MWKYHPPFIVYLTGEFSPNLDLKNMISTYIKDFHGKNGPNSPDFEFLKLQIARVIYDNFQKVAKNIKGYCTLNI